MAAGYKQPDASTKPLAVHGMPYTADHLHDAEKCTVGSFQNARLAVGNIQRLAALFREQKKDVFQSRLQNEFGIMDAPFAAELFKTVGICRRGAVLYPNLGELAVSFNGGKDACVVLYLWLAVLASTSEDSAADSQLQVVFFDSSNEFEGIRRFVAWVVKSLNLRMITIEQRSFRVGMEGLVDGGVRAVVMGQRSGDPWMANVNEFSPSTEGWPAFMRINPIITWSYSHVWKFLRSFELPYCLLYDQGYTSLGSVNDTLPNPSLERQDGSYGPAHELEDGSLERAGRGSDVAAKKTSESGTGKKAAASLPEANGRSSARKMTPTLMPRTAGIVVIGDEILNGKVHDANAHYLCNELHERGVAVTCIETVPDEITRIAASVRRVSDTCDFVFTSGGLGPTHDDKTMESVGAAFNAQMVIDSKFHAMLEERDRMRTDRGTNGNGLEFQFTRQSTGDVARSKMASVPQGATVEWFGDGNPWPLVYMKNVYIFAGMPEVFIAMFKRAASDGRFNGAQRWASSALDLDAEEESILDALQATVDAFPNVTIGSYPKSRTCTKVANGVEEKNGTPNEWQHRLSISFEAFDEEFITAARNHLVSALPGHMLSTGKAP